MRDRFEPALALLADLVVNPTFPAEAFARRQASMLVDLEQAKDVTSSIASVVFRNTVFTSAHPYGRTPNEETVKRITRSDLVAFHHQFFQPSHAVITVVGDVKGEE